MLGFIHAIEYSREYSYPSVKKKIIWFYKVNNSEREFHEITSHEGIFNGPRDVNCLAAKMILWNIRKEGCKHH